MEKKGATIALISVTLFLAGFLLGGTVGRLGSSTITLKETITVAERTVEVPVRHQPAVYSATASTVCLFVAEEVGNVTEGRAETKCVKHVKIHLWLRQLGREESYVKTGGILLMVPGLNVSGAVSASTVDYRNWIVIPPRTSTWITVMAEVKDPVSLSNWVRDTGGVSLQIRYADREGNELGTMDVQSIPLIEEGWWFNSTEAGGQ